MPSRVPLSAACIGLVAGALTAASLLVGRLVAGLFVLAAFIVVVIGDRRLALTMTIVWLTFLGLIRRSLIPLIGYPVFDPLLLLGPAAALLLWMTAPPAWRRTPLSVFAQMLFGTVVAQLFNPATTNHATAALSLLFWLGPLLWFFAGRRFSTHLIDRLFSLVTWLLVPVAAHGLLHSFGYFFPFEYTWVGVSGFGEAIFLSGFRIRPFSSLTSPQEYGYFLSFGLSILWAKILTEERHRELRLALFALAATALFLQASRTIFLFFGVMVVATATVAARRPGVRLIVAAVALPMVVWVVAQSFAIRQVKADPPARDTAGLGPLVAHQVEGFTDPEKSTFPLHRQLIFDAFLQVEREPFGAGLSEGTLAEKKVAKNDEAQPENDVATVFLALGMSGGLIFVALLTSAYIAAQAGYRREPNSRNLGVVAVLFAFVTQWYGGQLYAVSALVWLTLGWLSRGRPLRAGSERRPTAAYGGR